MLVILFPFTRPSTTTIATLSPPFIQVDPDSVETYTAQRGSAQRKCIVTGTERNRAGSLLSRVPVFLRSGTFTCIRGRVERSREMSTTTLSDASWPNKTSRHVPLVAPNSLSGFLGTWERNVLRSSQQSGTLGAQMGQIWKSSPANFMTLPVAVQMVDVDKSGTIDREEFRRLLAMSGSSVNSDALFNKLDKDGDETLTRDEIAQLLDVRRSFMKARNP